MKLVFVLFTGVVFGTGIALSGMMDPAKVLNFFDLAGSWDASLAFVMGGALIPSVTSGLLLTTCREPLLPFSPCPSFASF